MPLPAVSLRRIAAVLLAAAAAGTAAAQTPAPPAWALTEAGRLTYEGEINRRTVPAGPRIYFTTRRGWVYAVDTAVRSVAWRFGAELPISRPPAVAPGLIAAVDDGRTVYCLTPDGLLNWSYRADGPFAADPVWLGRRLVVALRSGTVIALNAEHPGEVWRAELGPDAVRALAGWEGRVLCACADGRIRALDADGRPAGSLDVGGPPAGPLTVDGNMLYAGREDGTLCALDAATGGLLWRARLGGEPAAPAVVDGRRLYVAAGNGVLFALSRGGGDILWWRPLASRLVYGPALWLGRVVAASASPVLSSFHPRTGQPAGEFRGPLDWRADPLERDGLLLLHVYDPEALEGTLIFLDKPAPPPAKTPEAKKEGDKSR